jgi:hypothetical protein
MIVYLKWQTGGDVGTVDIEGTDTLETVRDKVAAVSGVHPQLQQLVFKGKMMRSSDDKIAREYGITLEEDLRLSSLPGPIPIKLKVGGVIYTTLLSTLRSKPESLLAKMFDGAEHHAVGADGLMEAVPGGMSTVLVPKDPADGSFVIDGNGACFAYILDYLRRGEVALPDSPQLTHQLAIEAVHFGVDDLAAICDAGSLAGCAVSSLATLANACGGGATPAEIAALSDVEVTELLKDHTVNFCLRSASGRRWRMSACACGWRRRRRPRGSPRWRRRSATWRSCRRS